MSTIVTGSYWKDQASPVVWEVLCQDEQAFRLRSPLRDQVVTEAWFQGKMKVSDESFTDAPQRS